jgi:tripartite-type tricarboxylate transporter receptor subunit TctC
MRGERSVATTTNRPDRPVSATMTPRLRPVFASRSRRVRGFALAVALACAGPVNAAATAAAAPAWPQRPVRLIVPFAPGGATDIVARVLAPRLAERAGQPVLVDNRAGAAGNIAVDIVAASQPDGHTVLVGNISTNAINPLLFAGRMKSDALRDLSGVTLVAAIPNVILGNHRMPNGTLKDLLSRLRERPGEFNYQAPLGSYSHLDMLALLGAAKVSAVHLPSRGAGDTASALLRDEIQFASSNIASNIGAIRAGQLRAYAVTSPQRVPELPDVPTLAEAGFPGIGSTNWNGLFVPRATPRPAVQAIFRATVASLREAEVQDFFARRLIPAELSDSPEAFDAFVRAQALHWTRVIRENKVRID